MWILGVSVADSLETLGVDLRTQTKRLEAKETKVPCEVLAHLEEQRFPEKLHEDWCEEAVANGPGPRESVGRASRLYCAHIEVKIEEADGSSSRQERLGIAFVVSWS